MPFDGKLLLKIVIGYAYVFPFGGKPSLFAVTFFHFIADKVAEGSHHWMGKSLLVAKAAGQHHWIVMLEKSCFVENKNEMHV